MKKYKQLDLQDRHQIKALLDAGHCQTKIAQIIGVHKSTISREFSRNVAKRGPTANTYQPDLAQKKTDHLHHDKPEHKRFAELLKILAAQWIEQEKYGHSTHRNTHSQIDLSNLKKPAEKTQFLTKTKNNELIFLR